MSPLLQAALAYARRGWRVFPVAADGRSPLIAKGCHAASADPDVLGQWWASRPDANVALACGPESGVLALDVDRKGEVDGFAALAELEFEFGSLPATVRSQTPSGGAHLLFRYPIGVSPANRVGLKRYAPDGSRRVYHGLDVRAAGASICLPPSSRADGAYAWTVEPTVGLELAVVPRWLLALMLSEPPARPPSPPLRATSADRLARYVAAAVNAECADLAACRAPGRNLKLFQAAANLGEFVGADLLLQSTAEDALERAAEECRLVAEDGLRAVQATIASGMKRGIAKPREIAA